MSPLDHSDLAGCTMCRFVMTMLEDREDAVWRGDWVRAVFLTDLIQDASVAVE